MAKSAVAQSHCDVIVNACAKILCQRVHIADIGAVVDASLAEDSLPDTDIATAGDDSTGCSAQGRVEVAGGVVEERTVPMAVLPSPVVL